MVFSFSIAREDPFTPIIEPKDSIRPYYGETRVFKDASIDLPSNARLIKKIEVTFQNIDGSIETKSINVSGKVDWRIPLIISQVNNKNKASIKSTEVNLDIEDSSNDKFILKNDNSIIKKDITGISPKKAYEVDDNSIFIAYEGKLQRHFIMQNPYRIVFDFDINQKYYKNNIISINKPYFKSLKYGLHTEFLRIVLELDGSYVYELNQKKGGILINVK